MLPAWGPLVLFYKKALLADLAPKTPGCLPRIPKLHGATTHRGMGCCAGFYNSRLHVALQRGNPPRSLDDGRNLNAEALKANNRRSARLRNFPVTGQSDRRNVPTSHRRSLRKLQFPHHRLEAWLLAQGIEQRGPRDRYRR